MNLKQKLVSYKKTHILCKKNNLGIVYIDLYLVFFLKFFAIYQLFAIPG